MNLYADNILDHYRAPRGKLEAGSWKLEAYTESNPACGDKITVGMDIHDNHVKEICWDGTGCAISQAAMSILSEELVGKSTEEIYNIHQEEMLTMLGVPIGPRRLKCALLGLQAIKKAVKEQ